MAIEQNTKLVQSITLPTGDLVDLSLMLECAFVETIDLSGPRLILKFNDELAILRNIQKIKIGDALKVSLSTEFHDGDNAPLVFTADFVVMSMPVQGGMLVLNCLQKDIAELKRPAISARMWDPANGASIETVIKDLVAGSSLYTDIDEFALLGRVHLLPGDRPSAVLRRLAIEHGASIYARRGTLYFRDLSQYYDTPTNVVFQYNNPHAEFQIAEYRHLNYDDLIADQTERKFFGWNIIDGFVQADRHTDKAPEWSGYDQTAILNNLSKVNVPVLDIITWGTGRLGPGLPIDMQWILTATYQDSALDESLPTHAVIGNVSHYMAGMNYYCRLKALVPADKLRPKQG